VPEDKTHTRMFRLCPFTFKLPGLAYKLIYNSMFVNLISNSVLGVRSDSTDETIRRYYKKQAVLVHPDKNLVPGAEEAFKILARAFEILGEPLKRQEYHHKLLEAHAKEQVYGEIGKLLEQLRKKMEIATGSIR
jgi:DnaJ family protein C protein 14